MLGFQKKVRERPVQIIYVRNGICNEPGFGRVERRREKRRKELRVGFMKAMVSWIENERWSVWKETKKVMGKYKEEGGG